PTFVIMPGSVCRLDSTTSFSLTAFPQTNPRGEEALVPARARKGPGFVGAGRGWDEVLRMASHPAAFRVLKPRTAFLVAPPLTRVGRLLFILSLVTLASRFASEIGAH